MNTTDPNNPGVGPPTTLLAPSTFDLIQQFIYDNKPASQLAAPACKVQTPLGNLLGQPGVYPHVNRRSGDPVVTVPPAANCNCQPRPQARLSPKLHRAERGLLRHAPSALWRAGRCPCWRRWGCWRCWRRSSPCGSQPSASTDTLVNRSSAAFKATERFKKEFGDDAVVVLVKGDLERTLLTSDLATLIRLEGCLSGNVPAKADRPNGQVTALGRDRMPPVCTAIAKHEAGEGGLRAGHVHQHRGGADRPGHPRPEPAGAAAGRRRPQTRGATCSQRPRGYSKAKQDQLARRGRPARAAAVHLRRPSRLALQYGLTSPPVDRQHRVRRPSSCSTRPRA